MREPAAAWNCRHSCCLTGVMTVPWDYTLMPQQAVKCCLSHESASAPISFSRDWSRVERKQMGMVDERNGWEDCGKGRRALSASWTTSKDSFPVSSKQSVVLSGSPRLECVFLWWTSAIREAIDCIYLVMSKHHSQPPPTQPCKYTGKERLLIATRIQMCVQAGIKYTFSFSTRDIGTLENTQQQTALSL